MCICPLSGGTHLHWCPDFDIEADLDAIPVGMDSANRWGQMSQSERRRWIECDRARIEQTGK